MRNSVTPEQAAELTAGCSNVEVDHTKPKNQRWWARVWRDSKFHYGEGETALEAVVNAHKEAGTSSVMDVHRQDIPAK